MTSLRTARGRFPTPIRWLRTHPRSADLIFAIVLTALALTAHLAQFEGDEGTYADPAWWTVLLLVAASFPIAWRRTNPVATACVVTAAQVIAAFANSDGAGFLGVLIALYSLGAHSFGPQRARALTAITASILVLFVAGLVVDELMVGQFVTSVIVLVTGFVLGDNLRRRREAADALHDRLANAERERELVAHQRVTAERTRIARELHDVVAHSVSVMVIQAAAARRSLATSPENTEIALANVEATGRRTMDELRGLLGVLRRTTDAAPPGIDAPERETTLEPQPSLADIASLVTSSPDLPVTLTMPSDLGDVPASVDLTGFRIVEESLTNIRRHAGTVSSVTVTVERGPDWVGIAIRDDGRGAAADQRPEPGYGLIGMRERVDAIGGHLATGWSVGGGWAVTARLPLTTTDANAPAAADPPSPSPVGAP